LHRLSSAVILRVVPWRVILSSRGGAALTMNVHFPFAMEQLVPPHVVSL